MGAATLLTPKPVPSRFCPDLQRLAAPLPLQTRGRNSEATLGARDHAGSPGAGGGLRVRIKGKRQKENGDCWSLRLIILALAMEDADPPHTHTCPGEPRTPHRSLGEPRVLTTCSEEPGSPPPVSRRALYICFLRFGLRDHSIHSVLSLDLPKFVFRKAEARG